MADPYKGQVMRQMLPPTCVRKVKCFIDMCTYYRRFIPNFSAVVRPLIKVTKKFPKFEWNKESQASLDFLKETLTTVPVLVYPDTSKPYIFIQMLMMIALGNVYARSRIHKRR